MLSVSMILNLHMYKGYLNIFFKKIFSPKLITFIYFWTPFQAQVWI